MLLSVRQLSAILKAPEATVYRWIRDHGLPARDVSGHFRAHPVDLLEWLADHPVPVDPRALPTDGTEEGLHSLEAAIRAGEIFGDIPGVTRREVLSSLADRMPPLSGVPRDDLKLLLLRRESIGTTFLKEGIALPSPRHPLIVSNLPPMLFLGLPTHVIPWNESGVTVRVIFSLITPTVRDHLRLIGRVIFAFHDPNFRNRIATRASSEQILAAARDLDHRMTLEKP